VQDILISGAGLAGSTLGYWLARHGFTPTVVERAPALRAGGQGVDVREQAIEVAERMGIMGRIRSMATDVSGMRFVDAAGRDVARIETRAIQEKNATGEVEIMRGDLTKILYEATERDVEYLFDDSIRTIEQSDDGVTVAFEHGPTRRFDLVVGADGLHSTVRRLVFGPEDRFLRYMGHYAAFAETDPALGEDGWVTAYNEPGRLAAIYRSRNHAGAKAEVIFARREPLHYDYRDLDAQRRLLDEAFAGMGWRTAQLLAGARTDPDLYFDALAQVRMASWSAGRVTLVGDAGYCASPVSGSGARLAMVGAYRLAGELAGASDHRVAFRRYAQGHRALVDRAQRVGPNLRLLVPKTRFGRWMRNNLSRLPLGGMEGIMRRDRVAPLPDYASVRRGVRP
jgi:2-polyprenyl-6-methoxyphenol hydroxylase-like FAD-dependent oxidoreductase